MAHSAAFPDSSSFPASRERAGGGLRAGADRLSPARGIMTGLALSAIAWVAIFAGAALLLHG